MRLIGRRSAGESPRRPGAESPWGRREQPYLRAAILVVAIAALGLLVYRQVERWRGEKVTIFLAASDLDAGTTITGDDLIPLETRAKKAPRAAMKNRQNIVGTVTTRLIPEGSAILARSVTLPTPEQGPGLAGSVPEGRVLMTYALPGFPIADLATMLRFGDRFDIFAFSGGAAGPLHMARDVVFLGWIRPRAPDSDDGGDDGGVGSGLVDRLEEAAESVDRSRSQPPPAASPLLLGVRPEDVRRLVWAQNARVPLSVILHGTKEVEGGELLPFPMTRAPEVELILGANRQKLPLQSLQ